MRKPWLNRILTLFRRLEFNIQSKIEEVKDAYFLGLAGSNSNARANVENIIA